MTTPRAAHGVPADVDGDWNPHGADVDADQRAVYDAMRARCPVARDSDGGWTIFRHADVTRVLHDHKTFSNVVSRHLSVPNGMDPPVHGAYRRLVESYFTSELVAAFEPACRALAGALVDRATLRQDVEVMADLAFPFAAEAQCAYLGWPHDLAKPLVDWTRRNHDAARAGDRDALAAIGRALEDVVADLVSVRQERPPGRAPDLTDRLITGTVDGRRLTLEELTSLLRNWTMGEVGTLAAATGIVVAALADNAALQHQLRRHLQLLPDAIDELLRLHGPLVSNRRTVTTPVTIGGRHLDAQDRLTINWIAANRDPDVFADADTVRLDRDPSLNLLYGAGIHVCPGAGLARLELRIIVEELLAATHAIEPATDRSGTFAPPPASGYATLPLHLVRA